VPKRAIFLNFFVFFTVLVCDLFSKLWVQHAFVLGESRPLLAPWVDLTYHLNPGAAFGLWKNSPHVLTGIALFFIIVLSVWLVRLMKNPKASGGLVLSLVLILAGAVGNLIDRLRLGVVVDFIDLKFWPIFNIADSAITVGAATIILITLLERRTKH